MQQKNLETMQIIVFPTHLEILKKIIAMNDKNCIIK